MHFLYPSHRLRTKRPDEFYAEELACLREAGFGASVFSLEEFQSGSFCASPGLPAETTIYRGWMLSASDYEGLAAAILGSGAQPLTDPAAYLVTHHLPNWYPLISDLTPETCVFPPDTDLAAELRSLEWPAYFIKDYVKSLKTSVGSNDLHAGSTQQSLQPRCAGSVERSRRVLRPPRGELPARDGAALFRDRLCSALLKRSNPPIVVECARRIPSRFFSVHVVEREDGVLRVVEVGDGQVSDLVGWTPHKFVWNLNAFSDANATA